MEQRKVQWLYRELPELVAAEVLSTESAERIRAHYGPIKLASTARIAVVFFGILGGLLIGSGVILLFAYNWSDLGRPTRVGLSFAPLIIGQFLAGWTLLRRRGSVVWREGSASFLTMGVGASISLIGQTYHIPGDMAGFLFVWVLLSLPLIYLLETSTVAALYLIGTTAWAATAQNQGGQALLYWPLLAAVLPFMWQQYRAHRKHLRTSFLMWMLCLNVSVGLGIAMEKVLPGLWIVNYAALFGLLYLIGRTGHLDVSGHPFRLIGSVGTVILATILTFDHGWRRIGYQHYRGSSSDYKEWFGIQDYLLALVLIGAVVLLAGRTLQRKDYTALVWVTSPVLAIVGYSIATLDDFAFVSTMLFNTYLFVLGIIVLTTGLRRGRLLVANGGMGILALLFGVRFFDGDMSILGRGMAFIVIGVAFLGANLWISRSERGKRSECQS